MTQVLSLENPRLILSELDTDSGRNDQKGFMQILAGSYLGIRNPKAHSLNHDLDAEKAAQLPDLRQLAGTPNLRSQGAAQGEAGKARQDASNCALIRQWHGSHAAPAAPEASPEKARRNAVKCCHIRLPAVLAASRKYLTLAIFYALLIPEP